MGFIGELHYTKSTKTTESFAGRPFYNLTEPFGYQNDAVKTDYKVMCPKGFETDFASIPEYFIFFDPKDERWQRAAVIHDRACKLYRDTGELTAKEADDYLYYAMLDCGSGKFYAYTFYLWVRARHLFH